MKKTPLYENHVKLGAKIVDYAGWLMPVQYEGVKPEHLNVRKHGGLFDVSHMGEIRVKGPESLPTLQWLTTNDVSKLSAGQAHYSLLPNDKGGIVDDLIVYCLKENEDYLLCVNASNTQKALDWVTKNNKGAQIENESDIWAQIAIQGKNSYTVVKEIFGNDPIDLPSFNFLQTTYNSKPCIIAKTGYTGEMGFEVFVENSKASDLWNEMLKKGESLNIKPIGLAARDTLRTEMKYSLYGHEIDDNSNPYEAGLGWVVKPKAKDFIGKELILKKKEEGLSKKLVGFKMVDRGIAREGYKTFSLDDNEQGWVTSGTPSPSLGENIGIAYVNRDNSEIGTEFNIQIRLKMAKAVIVKTPFVNPVGE